jgi:hypothetical protein
MRRLHLSVFLLMLGLVALYTWPLVTDLAHLFPDNPDPRTLGWEMLTVAHNLVAQPAALLHGNAFYPIGLSLTFTEPLLAPALVAGPLHALSGNPILAYNVTLILFWALSGWAMYVVAVRITRDRVAALIAAAIFTLCAYRTEMYVEFNMEMTFGIPLAVYALVRFLESQRARYLVVFLVVFWLQTVTVLYYGVILACGLAVVVVEYAALRWGDWRLRTPLIAAAGAGGLGVALAPVAWPFLVTRRELGFERSLAEIQERSSDVLTYFELRPNWLYQVTPPGYYYETSLYMGGVAMVLAALAGLWLARGRPGRRVWPERGLALAGVALAVGAVVLVAGAVRGRLAGTRYFTVIGVALLACLVARQAVEGWRRRQHGIVDRRLDARAWVWLLLGLALVAFLLSLGPVVAVAGQPIGPGLYKWLYPYVLPLRGLRAATRIGVLIVFAGALLAAFGVTWLRARLPHRAFVAVTAALGVLLALEYATFPLIYDRVPSVARPVDAVLRAAPADTVVLEWPTYAPLADADAMFRSLVHGKRIVNGYAGFVPALQEELSKLLTLTGPSFPVPAAEAALRRIYPLDLLVVRLTDPDLSNEWRATWKTLRRAPPAFLRFRGSYGDEDLWEVAWNPERGTAVERWASFEFLHAHPVLRARLRVLAEDPTREQFAEVRLNGRLVAEARIDGGDLTATLPPPYYQAAPNVVALGYGYRRPRSALDDTYRVGTTGTASPVDLRVRSAGMTHGDTASIAVNGIERAVNRRGYNLVALEADGRIRAATVFDTFFEPDAASRLAGFVTGLPAGTVVVGAVRDEASGRLTDDGVAALRTLGVAGDLRGRFRESHAFVGVKGAAPGTALEVMGPRSLTLTVGRPSEAVGFELVSFALEPVRPRR